MPRPRAALTLSEPAVVVQRTTAPEQTRRIVAVELTADDLTAWGGALVVENHVNVIRPTTPIPALSRSTLARVLATPTMDHLMRCLAGSVAVSAYELESLPQPAAEVLTDWETLSVDKLNSAVASAYHPVAM